MKTFTEYALKSMNEKLSKLGPWESLSFLRSEDIITDAEAHRFAFDILMIQGKYQFVSVTTSIQDEYGRLLPPQNMIINAMYPALWKLVEGKCEL